MTNYFQLFDSTFKIEFYKEPYSFAKIWNSSGDAFFSEQYYNLIFKNAPENVLITWATVFHDDKPIAGYYTKFAPFDLSQSLNQNTENKENRFCKIRQGLQQLAFNFLKFNTLVFGNLCLAGPYHTYPSTNFLSSEPEFIIKVIDIWVEYLKSIGKDTTLILLKDLKHDTQESEQFKKSGYFPFEIEPDMYLLNENWTSIDQYLNDLHAKYRVRFRRARKKMTPIVKRKLTFDEVCRYNDKIYFYYEKLADKADFNSIHLKKEYFIEWTKAFENQGCITGYFLDDELVGFTTSIFNEKELDAHYLGYDFDLNHEHQLYLNMLYDLLEEAINRNLSLHLSRTATEIKSSLGAVEIKHNLYLRHQNNLINCWIPQLFEYFNPMKPWVARHPFKHQEIEETA